MGLDFGRGYQVEALLKDPLDEVERCVRGCVGVVGGGVR
jgi:hypothetical protein